MVKDKKPREPWQTNLGFMLLGLMNNFSYVIGISAAIDIVEKEFPKSIVLLCDIGPGFLISFIYPFFHQYFNIKIVAFVISLFGVLGYILAGLSATYGKAIGLCGVICFSCQIGNEGPSLAHSGKFLPDCTSSFCIGMGIAGLLGAGGYALLTSVFHIEYQIILYSFCPLPLLLNLGVWLTFRKPSVKLQLELEAQQSNVQNTNVEEITEVSSNLSVSGITERDNVEEPKTAEVDYTSIKEKGKTVKHNLLCFVSLWSVYVFQYTTTTGVNPTLIFGGEEKTYYRVAAFAIRIGNLIGRTSILYYTFPYWSLAVFSAACLCLFVLFVLQSLYRFITSIWIMLAICPLIGFCSGVIYSDTMTWVQKRNLHPNQRSYGLAVAGMCTNLGVICSSLIGSGVEILLKKAHPGDWIQ
ncbi:CLN3 protein [Spironucleus salmonicida]|uniref:CLN3 protein n=1 Tax=Spironucleus salmonicida TaxID=348837 RepID=V6LJ97_9EUKA|nr:CLN3 protein [Spironucleus salmonicida]|eukprot:EST43766.1 CLN3 protein [Spironucleus salmonicida]